MNTHDKYELPPLPETDDLFGQGYTSRSLKDYACAAIELYRQRRGETVAWIHEDDLPNGYPYDDMYPFSKVDGVRMFPVFWPDTVLTLGYLEGHKDGLEWAAQLAEANHPLTSDWLYDDRHDLAKAIRKGPEMPPVAPQPADPTIKDSLTVAEPVKVPTNEDAKFLDWLSTNLFERKWDGTIGNPCEWHLRGDWRHTLQRMKGPDIRAAITQAMQQDLFS